MLYSNKTHAWHLSTSEVISNLFPPPKEMLLYVNQVSILKTFSRHLSHTFVLRHLVNKCWCCNPQQMSCAWCGDRQAYEIECWMSKRGGKIAFFSCPKVKMQVAERLLKGEDLEKIELQVTKDFSLLQTVQLSSNLISAFCHTFHCNRML